MLRRSLGLLLGLGALGVGCLQPVAFPCGVDEDCRVDGVCEAVGFCSEPDETCPSGRRFSEHAGDGLAGACTDPEGGTESTSSGGGEDATSAETASASTSTTGETEAEGSSGDGPAVCGNGNRDPGEACDDGNDIDGDGCNVDCTPSGAELDVLGIGVEGDDRGHAIALGPKGERAIAGQVLAADLDARIVVIAADGRELWSTSVVSDDGSDDVGWGVAMDSDGAVYAAGELGGGGELAERLFVRAYEAGGESRWGAGIDAVGRDVGRGVAVAGTEATYVVGASGGASVVRRYDAQTGAEQWTRSSPVAEAMAVDAGPGGLALVAGVEAPLGSDALFVRAYSPLGAEVLTVAQGGAGDERASGTAWAAGGAFAIAGRSAGQALVSVYEITGSPRWIEPGGAVGSVAHGVAVGPDGSVVAVGSVDRGGNLDAWVRKFGPDAEDWWTQEYAGAAGGDDEARGVRIDAQGRVHVVGYETTADGEDGLLLLYAP